jgi:hypothetical protein
LRTILRSLSLHGTILRHAVDTGEGAPYYATFIAFEALLTKGAEFVGKIMAQLKQLPMMKGVHFGGSYYDKLADTISTRPTVKGISIAETDSRYARNPSSGLKYDLPSGPIIGDIFQSIQKHATDAVDLVHFVRGTRYRFSCHICLLIIVVPDNHRNREVSILL